MGLYKQRNHILCILSKNENEEKLLLFPLIQDLGEIYCLYKEDNKTDILFNFSIFNEYLKNKDEFADIK